MVTKFGQFNKLKCREGSQLCKLYQLCYHFLSSFKNENNFFISLAIPRPSPFRIHYQSILPKKKIGVSVYFKQKNASLNRDIHSGDS